MPYIIGYPRIGEKRELKFALEGYWSGNLDRKGLEEVGRQLRQRHWQSQEEAQAQYISINDFSYYDQMLDMVTILGCEPEEYRDLTGLERYFAMARGDKRHKALPMTKWFNTNYHYFVPQLRHGQPFAPNATPILALFREFQERVEGAKGKVNLIGPFTFLALSRRVDGGDPLELLPAIVPAYRQLLQELQRAGVNAIQLEEPIFVLDPNPTILGSIQEVYQEIVPAGLETFLITYFERANEAVEQLVKTPIDGIGLDLVHGPGNLDAIEEIAKHGKRVVAGIVDGRNVWISDIDKKVALLRSLPIDPDQLLVAPSSSLLHVPYTLRHEHKLHPAIKSWLAFAREKLDELRLIDRLYRGEELDPEDVQLYEANRSANERRQSSTMIHHEATKERLQGEIKRERDLPAQERLRLQHERLGYPILPTTTIGSFPQTPEVRRVRKAYREGKIDKSQYEERIRAFIDQAIQVQEEVGLDILVHGEFERNDMVEYFGQFLEGVALSEHGWVQSYGSRCVKPPLIFGDVHRPEPMTLEWILYAQSKTDKPLKGMLTGPVTMLNWSFVRDDLSWEEIATQMALAIGDEVADLQDSGIAIIQVDEAAFKEGYPLRQEHRKEYERIAVESFKIATARAKPQTQIHTHMCYSDFNDIMEAIDAMDADVISIETARNGNRILEAFRNYNYQKEVGVGVYDIHSPRIPSQEEMEAEIVKRLEVFPASKLWINPDCGLKTRRWEEVIPALTNMVAATKSIRSRIVQL
ncbi:MAG: 5-methyltetrahydropteroyltriglutamate--homocysteine S-methyltransferase [Nitratiruptor sp.]|nr:5-methyltetrahydropteroyltriglutamate--homocysteine S-methyltransferase [Nitratiruptor sp.]NPA84041.1 5-methyltetrahydropteroyltriglutamate--homocysteine S-methyltransferase [Campylobacterota bacterium]